MNIHKFRRLRFRLMYRSDYPQNLPALGVWKEPPFHKTLAQTYAHPKSELNDGTSLAQIHKHNVHYYLLKRVASLILYQWIHHHSQFFLLFQRFLHNTLYLKNLYNHSHQFVNYLENFAHQLWWHW